MDYKVLDDDNISQTDRITTISLNNQANCYNYHPSPIICSHLTKEQESELHENLAFFFSEGKELILESMEAIYNLMVINFKGVFNSDNFKKNKGKFAERLIKYLSSDIYLPSALQIMSYFLNNSEDLDSIFLSNKMEKILSEILFSKIKDNDFSIYGHLFLVSKFLVERSKNFHHLLMSRNFYDNISIIFNENMYDDYENDINEIIASFLCSTSKNPDLEPNEITIILELIPLLLQSTDTLIIDYGYEVLSRLSIQTNDVKEMLDDGTIIKNLCLFISTQTELKFLIRTIEHLSLFAQLGDKIIDMMNENNCLQNISTLFSILDSKLISAIFDLIINWLVHPNKSLDNMFILLQKINFISVFEKFDFAIKGKAIRALSLAARRDPNSLITKIVNFDLFSLLVCQISDNDDQSFSFDGCLLICIMIRKLRNSDFCDQLKKCLLNEQFCTQLENIQLNETQDFVGIANEIFSFIHE